MEEIFSTFSTEKALLIVFLTALGVGLRSLWAYFTRRISELEKRIDTIYDEQRKQIELSTKAIGDNTAILQIFVNTLIDKGLSAGGLPNQRPKSSD